MTTAVRGCGPTLRRRNRRDRVGRDATRRRSAQARLPALSRARTAAREPARDLNNGRLSLTIAGLNPRGGPVPCIILGGIPMNPLDTVTGTIIAGLVLSGILLFVAQAIAGA